MRDRAKIQETFLTENKQFHVPGYDGMRSDRLEARGGLIMLFKHGIKYVPVPSPHNIECQIAEISTKSGKIMIVNAYVPPSQPIRRYSRDLTPSLSEILMPKIEYETRYRTTKEDVRLSCC